MNRGTSTLPPVLQKYLLNFSKAEFGDLILTQRLRLLEPFTEEQLLDLEKEFKMFKSRMHDEANFRQMIEGMKDDISFGEAWSTIRIQYLFLCTIFGGLASVFPGTCTVESDFSIIRYEKDDYRTELTNFSLEGILHCKQFHLWKIINANID